MHDRFRFRIWCKEINEYLVGTFLVGGEMIHNAVDFESFLDVGNFVIEQCTGLKDKNGNLIYEGDIIRDRGEIMYKIQWKNASFFAVALDNFDYMPDCYLVQEWLNTWKAEIIGNIHEQAEQKD